MSRDRLECLVEAIEYLIVDENGIECLFDPNETPIVEDNGRFDLRRAHYIPHDVAQWFTDAVRRYQNGDVKSLDRPLGLVRPPGRPVDPDKSEKINLAEKVLAYRMQGKTRAQINGEIFSDRPDPPDERYLRTLEAEYKPLVMVRQLHRRWLSRSEERKQRSILKNSRKGKPDSNPR
jgi:hypothetical protein